MPKILGKKVLLLRFESQISCLEENHITTRPNIELKLLNAAKTNHAPLDSIF